jgi:hypothetical protein
METVIFFEVSVTYCIWYWIYWQNSELHLITGLLLIYILYKSPQHPLSLFPAYCVLTSLSLATASNSGDSSITHTQVLSSQQPVQNSLSVPSISNGNYQLRIPQSNSLLRLPTLSSQLYPQLAWDPRYIASVRTKQKTPGPTVPVSLLAYSLPRERVFTEPLPSNVRLTWLAISAFRRHVAVSYQMAQPRRQYLGYYLS